MEEKLLEEIRELNRNLLETNRRLEELANVMRGLVLSLAELRPDPKQTD